MVLKEALHRVSISLSREITRTGTLPASLLAALSAARFCSVPSAVTADALSGLPSSCMRSGSNLDKGQHLIRNSPL